MDLCSAGCELHRPLGVCAGYWPVAGPLLCRLIARSTGCWGAEPHTFGPSLTQSILLKFMVNYWMERDITLDFYLVCWLGASCLYQSCTYRLLWANFLFLISYVIARWNKLGSDLKKETNTQEFKIVYCRWTLRYLRISYIGRNGISGTSLPFDMVSWCTSSNCLIYEWLMGDILSQYDWCCF